MKNNSRSNKDPEESQCINILYDILTIFISIADITTDVIVLISFYNQGRTTFFVLSLIILIIAHMAYSVAFIWRYDVVNNENILCTIALFFILIPLGSIVSFIIFFTDNENSKFSQRFKKLTDWDVESSFRNNNLDTTESKMAQWIIKKLSKHIGFIIEAGIEALPQSLLQIIAIVYYKEANYISIISIFLSMFSVMTKSLVFSQGIDMKTYIWTWLCIVIDFFGIFFSLTFVFYTNDTVLYPQFFGYFSIVGQIWFYKVIISVSPCVVIGASLFSAYWLPVIMKDIWRSNNSEAIHQKVGWTLFFVIGGGIFVLIASIVGFIAIEIFCFSFLALGLFAFGTDRWAHYNSKNTNEVINTITNFITVPSVFDRSKDRMLRILAVNYSFHEMIKVYRWQETKRNTGMKEYIDKIEKEYTVNGLLKISFADIRNNCGEKKYVRAAKVFPEIWHIIKDIKPKRAEYDKCIHCTGRHWDDKFEDCIYPIAYWGFFIAFPVFFFCKVLQGIFPYVILGYLWH
eukprot:161248_1